jgi:putative oxidoreductase
MLIDIYTRALRWLDGQVGAISILARLVFAAVLFVYFWAAAGTKLASFPFELSLGAYAQVFPRASEAVGYDNRAMTAFHYIVTLFGTYAEYVLPLLIVIGLATRPAALGMIGFIIVQSATDILGHGASAGTIGAWFDRDSASLILDQRALWVMLLLILVQRGAGPLSIDRALARRFARAQIG